jgi:predicted NBD/HSP70 family sugar kinase
MSSTPANSAQQSSLRDHNLQLVFGQVAAAEEGLSRAEVAAITGLSRSTAASLVDQLLEGRLVEELEVARSGKAGRPATPVRVARGTVAGLGLEIGVDYVVVRAVDLAGRVLVERVRHGAVDSDPGVVFAALAQDANAVVETMHETGVRVAGAGLALPGLVDDGTGPLRVAPNLGWRDVDAAGLLNSILDVPVAVIGNEASLAARTELGTIPGAHSERSFIYVSGGVGIGAGITLEGDQLAGMHGWSGEIGHVAVDPVGPVCSCGANGCLEVFASRRAILSFADLPGADDLEPAAAALAAGGAAAKPIQKSLNRAGKALGQALAGVVNVTDIANIVIGGEFHPVFEALYPAVKEELDTRVLASRWTPDAFTLTQAQYELDFPAATGAALSVLDQLAAAPAAWLS